MESLALAVTILVAGVFLLGIPSVVCAIRPPTSRAGRVILMVMAPFSFASGAFLFVVVVTSFRLFGLGFMFASTVAVVRAVRLTRRQRSTTGEAVRSD